ncbi:MAG: glutathione peroxidase [Firmicutes bacterium]|nr:glutathione peroxidase [Bacillota bacterium]
MNIYDFVVKDKDGSDVSLADYKGKVLLIVNTATDCRFTPQYEELQALYNEFRAQGLEILDFPCNQFGGQASGTDEEILYFCKGRYGITFKQFKKVDVKGENANPLFTWLVENSKFEGADSVSLMDMLGSLASGGGNDIKWNFTKFLICKEGYVEARFEPTASSKKLKEAIQAAL